MSSPTQSITPELRQWIVAQAEAGCRPDDVLAAMKASGWAEDVAIDAMEVTLRERLDQLQPRQPAPLEALQPAKPLPEPLLEGQTVLTLADGHRVKLLTAMKHPRVLVFGGLLTNAECDMLMAQAAPRLLRSETVDNNTGDSEVNAARTSDGMFFERGETALIKTLEQRIAELLRWPLENGEGLQILRYRPGAEYKPHHDYFDPVHPGTPRILERGGQRVAMQHFSRGFHQRRALRSGQRRAGSKPQRGRHRVAGPAQRALQQRVVIGGNAPAVYPLPRQFQVLAEDTAGEGLAGSGQAQGQHVPAHHLGAGRQLGRDAVAGLAAAVGNGFQWQPFQPRAFGHTQVCALQSERAFAAIKTCGAGRGDQRVAAGQGVHLHVQFIAAHHTARRVHQHVVAHALAFRVQRLQHAQRAGVGVVRHRALAAAVVAQCEFTAPAGGRRAGCRHTLVIRPGCRGAPSPWCAFPPS